MDETGKLYFIEVNARVQVEHPVTEFVTGIDIVKSQIRIAAGRAAARHPPGPGGTARPRHRVPHQRRESGDLRALARPDHRASTCRAASACAWIRAAYTDCVIPPYYDSLVAKLITYGSDRTEAIQRMQRALEMFIVEGIHTSIPLHQRILDDPDFVAGKLDTGFLARTKLAAAK